MPAISGPSDGPVAVTGASGYIGSHVVKNLVLHGYDVHACLRDTTRQDKTSYLLELHEKGPGSVSLFSCDLFQAEEGDYDEAFAGLLGGIPRGGGHRHRTPRTTVVRRPRSSIRGSWTRRWPFSNPVARRARSSAWSIRPRRPRSWGPAARDLPDGHIFDENDWSGGSYETLEERHAGPDGVTRWTVEGRAYAKGKVTPRSRATASANRPASTSSPCALFTYWARCSASPTTRSGSIA